MKLVKRFTIMGGPSIPWAMIEPHEQQALDFHGQSLKRLDERGGLAPSEALCVLDDVNYFRSEWAKHKNETRDAHKIRTHSELERRRVEFEKC